MIIAYRKLSAAFWSSSDSGIREESGMSDKQTIAQVQIGEGGLGLEVACLDAIFPTCLSRASRPNTSISV
ncbi:hypothetical protein L1887_35725 [Cichorium endivia]|nr:hypothetical protein L1887_35725 [Cichorium endivia]